MESTSVRVNTSSYNRIRTVADKAAARVGTRPSLTSLFEVIIDLGISEYERRYLGEPERRAS